MAYPSALDLDNANTALARLGVPAISAFGENSGPGRLVPRVYPKTRRLLLGAVPWSFATQRVGPQPSGQPAYPWAQEFLIPAGVIRVREVIPSTADVNGLNGDLTPFEEGTSFIAGAFTRVVRTTIANPVLVVTADVDDPAAWDNGFLAAFTIQLAAELCLPITGNGQLAQAMRQEASSAITAVAPTSSVQTVTQRARGPSDTLAARG